MWGAGLLVSRRTRSAAAADLRAELAERNRVDQARRAVAEERARIARELHDIVSHGLSVVVLQTVAARAALQDGGDDDAERHLDAVEGTARDALGEMRRMLGLLQVGDLEPSPAAPSPGLRSLPALLDRAAGAGLRITAADLALDAELPSGLELAIYRVVQEALTNAVKHAPGSSVTIGLRIEDGAAVVTVVNGAGGHPGSPEGAGQGLIGMRQRAELYGGSLRTGPTPDGGFAVTATFLLDDVPAPAMPQR
jgi:signal transduction histidine kinase